MRDNDEYIALGKAFELFLANERFRVLGTADLGKTGYQHIGLEIWTKYTDFPAAENDKQKSILLKYILGMEGVGWKYESPDIDDLIYEFSAGGEENITDDDSWVHDPDMEDRG